jgi:hypothetical protein
MTGYFNPIRRWILAGVDQIDGHCASKGQSSSAASRHMSASAPDSRAGDSVLETDTPPSENPAGLRGENPTPGAPTRPRQG